ncbi:hypothetical protein D3C86_2152820 [compost metagenome]
MKKQSFIQELQERIRAETPPFFKMLQKGGKYLVGVGLSMVAIPQLFNQAVFPELIVTAGSYIATVGFMLSAVSGLAKTDKPV